MLHFHTQRIGIGFDRMFAGTVHPLEWNGAIGQDAADVDERSAVLAKMPHRNARSDGDSPEVRLEQPTLIFQRYIDDTSVSRDTGAIDPCIDPSKTVDCAVRHTPNHGFIGDISRYEICFAAIRLMAVDFLSHLLKRCLIPGSQHQTGTALSGHTSRHETDAA